MNHSVLKVARMGSFKLESSVLAESNALGNNHSFFFLFFQDKNNQLKEKQAVLVMRALSIFHSLL